MQFGMPTLIENRTLAENIALCSELGLKFIELNMNFPEYQIDKLEDTSAFIEAAEKAGIYYTIHLDENMNIADFNPLVTDAYLETTRRTISVAKALLPLRDRFGDKSQPRIKPQKNNYGYRQNLRLQTLYSKRRRLRPCGLSRGIQTVQQDQKRRCGGRQRQI